MCREHRDIHVLTLSFPTRLSSARVTATIANLREIDWNSFGINFIMMFAPGMLEAAPQTHIATVRADAETERALERAIAERFPNVSAIRVEEEIGRAHV